MGNAPRCMVCNRSTWNTSGYCYDHESMSRLNQAGPLAGQSTIMGPVQGDRNDTQEAVAKSFCRVFDEHEMVNTVMMGEAADQTIKGAVSIEAMRAFPRTDVMNPQERQKLLSREEDEIVSNTMAYSSNISTEDALGYINSSADANGIGYDEAMLSATFALKKEWELGRLQGLGTNRLGIPYSLPVDSFLARHRHHMQTVARVEFRRNAVRYPQIIQDVTGRTPQSPAPVVERDMARVLMDDSIPHQDKVPQEVIPEMQFEPVAGAQVASSIFKVAGWIGGKVKDGVAQQVDTFVSADRAIKTGIARSVAERRAEEDRLMRAAQLKKRRW